MTFPLAPASSLLLELPLNSICHQRCMTSLHTGPKAYLIDIDLAFRTVGHLIIFFAEPSTISTQVLSFFAQRLSAILFLTILIALSA